MFEIMTILAGAGAGITYSLTAWGKKEGQPFDKTKFASTVVIGAISGVAMSVANLPVDVAYQYVIGLGIVPIVENVMKAFYRKILP